MRQISLIRGTELTEAIEKTSQKMGVTLSKSLAIVVLDKMAKLKTRHKFVEAIRLALNEANVHPEERKVYASLIGCAYGRRSGRKKKRQHAQKTPPPAPPKKESTHYFPEMARQGELVV